jgi:hypothetical protein
MQRENTRSGLFANIGAASSYSNQYYFATDLGIYYYSDGTNWTTATFDKANSVYNWSGTIATGNTAQLVIAPNQKRKWLFFQNNSNADMYIGIGYAPTTSNGILVAKSGTIIRFDGYVPMDSIYVLCATGSNPFVCLEGY